MEVSPYNLKRYLGIPRCEEEPDMSLLVTYQVGHWLDHLRMVKAHEEVGGFDNKTVMLVSEPYAIGVDDLRDILKLCNDFNLGVIIDGASKWNPGHCSRIMLWRKGEG